MTPKETISPCGRKASLNVRARSAAPAQKKRLEQFQAVLNQYLDDNDLKRSDQRWKIALIVLNSSHHLTPGEIVKLVQEDDPGIGAATVYRNLKILSDAKILHETLLDSEGRSLYESFDDEHHDHLVCLDCKHIFEFHDELLEDAQTKVTEKLGFRIKSHRHVLYVNCNDFEKNKRIKKG